MSAPNERLAQFVVSAMEDGDIEAPVGLLDVLRTLDKPLDVFSSRDGLGELSLAIDEAFPSAQWHRLLHAEAAGMLTDVRDRYLARLRWLRLGLSSWSRDSDESRAVFVSLLITARMCGGQANLWELFPDSCRPSDEFLIEACSILGRYRITIGRSPGHEALIWESEFVQTFEAHDEAGRWDDIANQWMHLANAMPPNLHIDELARCLARYNMKALAMAADAQPKAPAVLLMSRCLPRHGQLELAMRSTSKRAIFCAVLSVLEEARRRPSLSEDDHDVFVVLLQRVMLDESEWRLWMRAFNRYPVRYPGIQLPLGKALAGAPKHAIESYVDAMNLSSFRPGAVGGRTGRDDVSACLRKFAAHADPGTRQVMWRHAFDRWHQWRQDSASHPHGQFDIQWSELDYAVSSYVAECLDAAERDQAMAAIHRELSYLDEIWHASLPDYITRANVLLSLFQPYGHVANTPVDGDMLATTQVYWPFDFQGSAYLRRLFHVKERVAG